MLRNHLQRLTIPLIHGEKEQRQHDHNHAHGRKAGISRLPEQKERRHSNQCRRSKADELAFGQPKQDFRFHPRQIARNRYISCYFHHLFLMCVEHAAGDCPGFKQGKHQKNRIAHGSPDGRNDIVGKRYRLDQYRIDSHTDHDEESLKSQRQKGAQIILADLALLPVAKGGKWNRRKAGQE